MGTQGEYRAGAGTYLYADMNALKEIRTRALVGVSLMIIAIVIILYSIVILFSAPIGIFGCLVFVVGICFFWGTNKKFKILYKKIFVEKQLRDNFKNVIYDWQSGFNVNQVESFGLCDIGNRFRSEDYLRAEYEGVTFEQSDVTVQDVRSNGRSTYTVTYFKGRMITFDFPEKFVSSVQIFSDQFKHRGRPFGNMRPQKVEMESVQFNKKFDVLALVPHDAFYLLTPHFMEKIDGLSRKYGSIAVHIAGNRVFMGFNEPNHNAFDVDSMMNEISYPEQMEAVKKDIDDIKTIIEILRDVYNSNNYYQVTD